MLTQYTSNYFSVLAEELKSIASELDHIAVDSTQGFHPYGTIVKAKKDQSRFKPKSMWVSLGDGTYKHLTGTKGLIATFSRLDGYVDVVFG